MTVINRAHLCWKSASLWTAARNGTASSGPKYLLANSRSSRFYSAASGGDGSTEGHPRTLALQNQLGNLPVPALKDTVAKFLTSVKPLLNESEMRETSAKIEKLLDPNGIGEKLQNILLKRKEERPNWLSDWWLELAYLSYRDPLPVWSSPALPFPLRSYNNAEQRLKFAANMIRGALDYKSLLDNQLVPVEMQGKVPMDMVTCYRLFGVNRTPRPKKDVLTFHTDSNHIIVACRNNFYKVVVKDANGKWMNPEQLYETLTEVVDDVTDRGWGKPVGVLTSDNRDNWAEAYEILVGNPINKSSIHEIEESLFILCLDEDMSHLSHVDGVSKNALQGLHGLDSNENRWFDKTIQLYVGQSGENGLVMEHSPSDAVVTMKICDHIMDFVDGKVTYDNAKANIPSHPVHLQFQLEDNDIYKYVQMAKQNMKRLIEDVEMKVLQYQGYGKNKIKSFRLSPDSFVQMAIQLTYYKMHHAPAATYESGGTRMFKEGRTETIRSCSSESLHFSKVMVDNSSLPKDKYQAFLNAIKSHNQYAREAAAGKGVDRHLTGLKKAALENGLPVPEFFSDPGYVRSVTMKLSTSQISSQRGVFTCYGPLDKDGYGVCYGIDNDFITLAVSALKHSNITDNIKFAATLKETLDELHNLCHSQAGSKL